MRKIILLCLVSVLITVIAASAAPVQPLEMFGNWKFDEGAGTEASDSTGHNPPGQIINADWAPGKVKKALEFNGESTDGSRVVTTAFNPAGDFSVEAWIQVPSTGYSSHGRIMATNFWGAPGLMLSFGGGTNVFFRITNGKQDFWVYSSKNLVDGQWHHIVGVIDRDNAANARIYVDGVDDTGGAFGSENLPLLAGTLGGKALHIGWDGVTHDTFFKGLIDEVAVYDQVLTAGEVSEHYYAGLAGHSIIPEEDALADQCPLAEGEYNGCPSAYKVEFSRRIVRTGRPGSRDEMVSSADVYAFDMSAGSCAAETGKGAKKFRTILAECSPDYSSTSDENGAALLGVMPGDYLIISKDPESNLIAGISGGRLRSGETRKKNMQVVSGTESNRITGQLSTELNETQFGLAVLAALLLALLGYSMRSKK